ncbi:helix-turn-helix domain-containing protein [Marinobacter aromaticivorans]|uniref:Helix-turn-helix domain-containing protein n=1 Tax=Marinobacter aromaticivorans TaxID=1494078 RepID=A0ABW2ISV4_9GAMM|nr:helix-turn-helix transcriptional regulator [Marinobacter aromaticivorans]
MASLLQQLKKRRLALGLKQSDMMLRAGMSRQQYQRLESRGNPRLDNLELIAQALNSELMLIPKDKLGAVIAVLEHEPSDQTSDTPREGASTSLHDDPWKGLLGDD